MSNSIKLSPKYGVNPTIPVCFFCGKPKNEVALLGKMGGRGEDIEAPMHMVIDYEPCDECKANMDMGITIMGVVTKNPDNRPPIQENKVTGECLYPTGAFAVVTEDAVTRWFSHTPDLLSDVLKRRRCFMDNDMVLQLIHSANSTES